MANRWAWVVALLLGATMLVPRAEAMPKVLAVLPLDVRHTHGRMTKDDEASLEEMLRDEASNLLPGWTVLTGDNTVALLEGNGIDPTKCTQASCHLEMARQIEAQEFFSGAVQYVDGEYTASIRLMDTNSGRILASASLIGKTTLALRAAFQKQAPEFFARAGFADISLAQGPTVNVAELSTSARPALAAVPAISGDLASVIRLGASTDVLVARDTALSVDANGTIDPNAAAQAWDALAAIKAGNPYRDDAAHRASKWHAYAIEKAAFTRQELADFARMQRLLPLASLGAKAKAQIKEAFVQRYGHLVVLADQVFDVKTGLVWERFVPNLRFNWAAARDFCSEDMTNWVQPRVWLQASFQQTGKTVRVSLIMLGGLMDRAGIRRGDVLLALNGKPITSEDDFLHIVHDAVRPGQRVQLRIRPSTGKSDEVVTLTRPEDTAIRQLVPANSRLWRLPTLDEIKTLVVRKVGSPAIDKEAFPRTPGGWFWTSTSTGFLWLQASDLWFKDGTVGVAGKGFLGDYVRCVR